MNADHKNQKIFHRQACPGLDPGDAKSAKERQNQTGTKSMACFISFASFAYPLRPLRSGF